MARNGIRFLCIGAARALGRGFRRPRCDKSSRQLRRRDRSRRRAADASAMPNAARVRVHGLFPRRTRIRGLGTAQGAWPCGGDRPSATGRADRAEVAVEAYSRPRPPLLPPCYHNCYPTRRDGVGKRTITERENALFSGQFGPRRDRPTRRRPNFKTAALNHSAILPTLWKYSCFPRTRMLDTWCCQRIAGKQREPSSSAPLYGGPHRRVNLRRCIPCITCAAEWRGLSVPCFLELLRDDPPRLAQRVEAAAHALLGLSARSSRTSRSEPPAQRLRSEFAG